MNLILFQEHRDHYTLSAGDERLEHVRNVLKLRAGDRFMVGVVNGPRGDATIVETDRTTLKVSVQWDAEAMPSPPQLHLILAIPRPATARKVLFDATTLGVHTFHFFKAEKGDPAYQKSSLWTESKWRTHVFKGAEQAFSTHLPEVTVSKSIEDALALIGDSSTRAALDVYEGMDAFGSISGHLPIALAIGGERGWSARERNTLRDADFKLYSLGERVLRVETAVTTALAVLLAKLGRI